MIMKWLKKMVSFLNGSFNSIGPANRKTAQLQPIPVVVVKNRVNY